jgi:uncharacterized membrane protein
MAFGLALRMLPPSLTFAGLWVGATMVSIAPAFADLRVCNETTNPVSIALGYRAERGWQSEGWWVASPTQCATVIEGDLNARYFYLFVADDIGGGAWDGAVYMCTRDESFTIFGIEDCLARGYERTGFFEVDTQNRTDWTLQLTEGRSAPSEEDQDPALLVDPDTPGAPPDTGIAPPPGGPIGPDGPDEPLPDGAEPLDDGEPPPDAP